MHKYIGGGLRGGLCNNNTYRERRVGFSVMAARRRDGEAGRSVFYRSGDVSEVCAPVAQVHHLGKDRCTPVMLEIEMGSSRGQQFLSITADFQLSLNERSKLE